MKIIIILIILLAVAFGCRTNPSLTPIPVPYNINGEQPR